LIHFYKRHLMTDSGVTMSVTPGPPGGKMISRTDSSLSKQAATSQASDESETCGIGCFSVGPGKQLQENEAKSGRNCNNVGSEGWKCPDPGCKTANPWLQKTCTNCNLPKHSANQFQRGQSKILKQL